MVHVACLLTSPLLVNHSMQALYFQIPVNQTADLTHFAEEQDGLDSLWDMGNKMLLAADNVINHA